MEEIPKLRRMYVCPVCDITHFGTIDCELDNHMRSHFPLTYGHGRLICEGCWEYKMAQIRKRGMSSLLKQENNLDRV